MMDTPTTDEFSNFLRSVHDLHLRADTAVRGALLRVIRFALHTQALYNVLIAEQWHFLVIVSLERESDRDQDYLITERMQALKLIKKCIEVGGKIDSKNTQLTFAQSLVAVASHKGDVMRRVCLETLRELSIVNPKVVAMVNGFSLLIEAVYDQSISDMSEAIILTYLYTLNDASSRRYIRPYLDLRVLIAPFTDLESLESDDPAESFRWKAAKTALVSIMRTWVGVIHITADDLGLPTLIRMLRDTKVSSHIQVAILETVAEIFEPLVSKIRNSGGVITSKRHRRQRAGALSAEDGPPTRISTINNPRIVRSASGSSLASTSSSSSSFSEKPYNNGGGGGGMSVSSSFSNLGKTSFSASGDGGSSSGMGMSLSRGRDGSEKSSLGFNLFSGFFSGAKAAMASPAPKVAAPRRSGGIFGSNRQTVGEGGGMSFVKSSAPSIRHVDAAESDKIPSMFSALSMRRELNECDTLHNITGSYSALLCCAFIHSEIIDSLCFLGVHGEQFIAAKSRNLLVDVLRTIARILPEDRCAELLTVPSLIEFAAAASERTMANKAHKASQMLSALADAFSILPARTNKSQSELESGGSNSGDQANILRNLGSGSASRPSLSGWSMADSGLPPPPPSSSKEAGSGNGSPSSRADSPRPNLNVAGGGANNNGNYYSNNGGSTPSARVIWNLMEEVKSISGGPAKSRGISGPVLDVMHELRVIMTSVVDKNDFNRQMETSRVIGKEGKEPFRWDWSTIRDMLEYSFQHPDRLSEALKSKWVKRVSGFYRCANDDKSFFSNLSWDVSNLNYLECACNLYFVLVEDPQGFSFLRSDRRGVLFVDIAKEIKDLFDGCMSALKVGSAASTNKSSLYNSSMNSSSNATSNAASSNVFRPASCQLTMAREYFTLLGKITLLDRGRALLDETSLVYNLSLIGTCRPLDYLSRIAITALAFTDHGYMSQLLIKSWWASGKASADLKAYTANLLGVLLDARPHSFREWGLDVLVSMLSIEDPAAPTPQVVRLLMQTVERKENLLAFLAKTPVSILGMSGIESVLVRLVAVPEGIAFLGQRQEPAADKANILDALIEEWKVRGIRNYVRQVDSLTVKTLSKPTASTLAGSSEPTPLSSLGQGARHIVISVKELVNLADQFVDEDAPSSSTSTTSSGSAAATASAPSSSSSNSARAPDSATVNLEGLLRVPWNVEVKLVAQAGYQTGANSPDYLKMDCFVDTSELKMPACSDVTHDGNRIVRVRALVLDEKGMPTGKMVASNKSVANCLLAGIAPVSRDGLVFNMGVKDQRPSRRKSANNNMTTMAKRQSIITLPSSAAASTSSAAAAPEVDEPVTVTFDSVAYDWSTCKPGHRQGKVIELGDNKFAVEVEGEPCTWIFSRSPPGAPTHVLRSRTGSMGNVFGGSDAASMLSGRASDASRMGSGSNFYLLEVVYYFRIETGQVGRLSHLPTQRQLSFFLTSRNCLSHTVPLSSPRFLLSPPRPPQAIFGTTPRHLYGELARSHEGLMALAAHNVVAELIEAVRGGGLGSSTPAEMRAAWLALGHVASTEFGFAAVTNLEPSLVSMCVKAVVSEPNFAIRGTVFQVLGLLSRCPSGSRSLVGLEWDCSSPGSAFAVAVPKNASALFSKAPEDFSSALIMQPAVLGSTGLQQYLPGGSDTDLEVLSLIAKVSRNPLLLSSLFSLFSLLSRHAFCSAHPASLPLSIYLFPHSRPQLPGLNQSLLENKGRLDRLRVAHPEIFDSRELWVAVMRMMEDNFFRLSTRRYITRLFGTALARAPDRGLQG